MNSTETPRTDSQEIAGYDERVVYAEFARQLERELNELIEITKETPTRSELLAENKLLKFRVSILEDRSKVVRQLVAAENELERHQPQLCDEIRMERDSLLELREANQGVLI